MITLKNKNFNQNVDKYFNYIDSYDFITCTCPSCNSIGTLIKHGFYSRRIKINNVIKNLTVLRVKCKECGKTHAVLPSFVIPYLLTSINDAVMVIKNELDISKCYSTKHLLKKSYSLWINRVLSFCDNISVVLNDLHSLVIECSKRFEMCFLQNHQGKFFCI